MEDLAPTVKKKDPGAGFSKLRGRVWLPPLIAFLVRAVIWQTYAKSNPYIIPTLDGIWESLAAQPDVYFSNAMKTLQEIAVGAGSAIVLVFLVAIALTEVNILERAFMPQIVIMMVTPVVAIAPALVVAFGFGMLPKYIVTGIVVFFPMLVNSLTGLRGVDPKALDVLHTLHASRWEVFRELRFPGSMPYVFAGLRISLPLAVVGAAVAEFVAAGEQAGLGSLVTLAAAQANLKVTWAAIVLLALIGVLLVGVLSLIQRRVLWWAGSETAVQ